MIMLRCKKKKKKKTGTVSHIVRSVGFVSQTLDNWICFYLQPEIGEFYSVGPV
jgi:hypothetical protein